MKPQPCEHPQIPERRSFLRRSFIEIMPSLECNLHCPLCDRGRDVPPLDDFKDIEILYYNFLSHRGCSISDIRISGGEPTLYHRINELIGFLRRLNPEIEIILITNGFGLKRLAAESLSTVSLSVSIYRETEEYLRKDGGIRSILESRNIPPRANIECHENLRYPGTQLIGFDPLHCYSAVLLSGTKNAYPCCRAHRFEQDFNRNYHQRIDGRHLFSKLKRTITDTDLCTHCPRMYADRALVTR